MQKLFIKVNVIFMALFLIISCDDTNPPNAHSDDPQIAGNESIAQELTQDYNGNDITFTFNNGVTLSILSNDNKGASNGKVTLKHIQNENYFNSVNDIVIDFADVKSNYTFTLEHTLKPNLVKGDITVFKYTPDRAKDKLNAQIVNFDYDAASGKINAKITGLGAISSGKMPVLQDGNNSRLIISWADRYKLSDGDEQVVMQVPYYEQPGGSCWATCAQMLTKAYPRDDDEYSNRLGVIDFIKYLKHTSLDEGIGLWDFKMNLPNAINLYSSTKTEVSTFVSSSNMLEEIINKLRENKPLIMNLTYPGVGRHAIMIIGYKRELISIAKINVKLLIHNPQNVGTESMYKWVDWEWLMKEKWPQEAYQILYPNKPLKTTELELLTMGLPINKYLGDLAFVVGTDSKNYSIGLQYDNSEANGYKWVFPNGVKCEKLPDTVSYIKAKLPVYNASKSSKDVEIKYKIIDSKTRKTIEENSAKMSIAAGQQNVGGTVQLNNLATNTEFEGELLIQMRDNNSKEFLDGYKLKFVITPSQKIIVTMYCSVTGKYESGQIDKAGVGVPHKTTFKGSGNKYVANYETETTITTDMKLIQRGTAQIIFDQPVNPTKIISFEIKGNGEQYFEGEKTADITLSCKLENIPLKSLRNNSIEGNEVCSYIKELNYQAISVDPKHGNVILKEFYCTDESTIYFFIHK